MSHSLALIPRGRVVWLDTNPKTDIERAYAAITVDHVFEEERVHALDAPFEQRLRVLCDAFADRFDRPTSVLLRLPMLERLAGVVTHYCSDHNEPGHVYRISRRSHSVQVAARKAFARLVRAARLCERMEEALREAWIAFVIGLFHDVGHPAGSHDADDVLSHLPGMCPHELRGVHLILQDADLRRFLERTGAPVGMLVQGILEHGLLGPEQSIMDTVGYSVHDCNVAGFTDVMAPDLFWRISCSIDGVRDNRLVLNDTASCLDALRVRALLFERLYFCRQSRVEKGAVRRLFALALATEELTPEQLIYGTDEDIEAVFGRWFNHGGPEPWVHSALRLARNDLSALSEWEEQSFHHKDDFERAAKAHSTEGTLLLPACSVDSKQVHVIHHGLPTTLRYRASDPDVFMVTHHIYTYRG